MEIHWGTGSAFGLGRIPGTVIRVERMKGMDGKWSFLISDDHYTYLHVDNQKFDTVSEMTEGVFEWLKMRGRI